tara:strand:- start:138 stop:410 length:273 start_codon:yes stop_codon:yes gene_type:complete
MFWIRGKDMHQDVIVRISVVTHEPEYFNLNCPVPVRANFDAKIAFIPDAQFPNWKTTSPLPRPTPVCAGATPSSAWRPWSPEVAAHLGDN